ncbi:MAG: sulfotransferase domain-containing protein [Geminicoccaceae bacterium]
MPEQLFCPDFIGIGAQKCATTWIADMLGEHPGAFVPPEKELDFFSSRYDRGHGWYRACFEENGAGIRGEVSPSYLTDPSAPARIRSASSTVRLLLALRDPVERAYSAHLHELRKGHIGGDLVAFERALALNPMYVDQSRYAFHLTRWLEHFDRDRIHIVLQEEIRVDPLREATRLFKFLGLDPDARPQALYERRHESVAYRSGGARALFRTTGRYARKLGFGKWVAQAKDAPLIGRFYHSQRMDMRQSAPPMSDAVRARLVEELASDMRELQALTGRSEFPWPSWRESAR